MKNLFSKKLAFVLLTIGVLIGAGCKPAKPPEDFAFTFSDDLDEVNTLSGKFRRNLGARDSVADISFTAEEMQAVYTSLIEFKFSGLPQKIHTEGACMVPSPTYYLSVRANGQTKRVVFDDHCDLKGKDGEAFSAIKGVIMNLLKTKPAYKKMPDSNVLFL